MRALIVAFALVVGAAAGRAQPAPVQPPVQQPPPAPVQPPPPAEPPPTPEELARRIELLWRKQRALERDARIATATHDEVSSLLPLAHFITVFVDVGAFAVAGDGSGIRSDLGNFYFPKYLGQVPGQWVFMGDPLSTAINALGEPADTSDSRELKTDTIHSHGHPSLIVNSVGLSIAKDVGHGFSIASLAEFLPRPGADLLDVEVAYIEYRPFPDVNFAIDAGKVDSVLGIEYRSQDAPRRVTVTPSLICRYTCARQLGIRLQYVRGPFSAYATVTDGNSFQREFEQQLSLHGSAAPTGALHVQWLLPFGQGLELGASGAFGPQDDQPDLGVHQWHVGVDLRLSDFHRFDVYGELVRGKQEGAGMAGLPCGIAPCLDYKGGYLLVDRRMNTWLEPYVRLDWRDAVHVNGAVFAYESHVIRATIGVHVALTYRILGKVEYTFNHELDGIPQFPDDVLTSSLVVATD